MRIEFFLVFSLAGLVIAIVHGLPSPKTGSNSRRDLFESYEQRQELFYYISNDFQLNMINKLNRVSLTSIRDVSKYGKLVLSNYFFNKLFQIEVLVLNNCSFLKRFP